MPGTPVPVQAEGYATVCGASAPCLWVPSLLGCHSRWALLAFFLVGGLWLPRKAPAPTTQSRSPAWGTKEEQPGSSQPPRQASGHTTLGGTALGTVSDTGLSGTDLCPQAFQAVLQVFS